MLEDERDVIIGVISHRRIPNSTVLIHKQLKKNATVSGGKLRGKKSPPKNRACLTQVFSYSSPPVLHLFHFSISAFDTPDPLKRSESVLMKNVQVFEWLPSASHF